MGSVATKTTMGLPARQSETRVRIILVGKTGADAALRLNPNFEVARANTPLEAMGEVAHPMGHVARTVVVLGDDVLAALQANPASEAGCDRTADFVACLRRLDASLVVLAIEGCRLSPVGGAVDGLLNPQHAVQGVEQAIQSPARPATHPAPLPSLTTPTSPAAPAPVPAPPKVADLPAPTPTQAALGSVSDAGDGVLVALSLRGVDFTDAALALIRERTGDATVTFVPLGQPCTDATAASPTPANPARPSGIGAAVSWDDQVFGTLFAASAPPGGRATDLATHAKWLAGWLRLSAQQAQLREAAFKDGLTGAWNRRYFDRFLEAAIGQARAARRMLTVMVFDIDDFKQFNDRYGHDAGDEILTETVKLLNSVIRPTDRVCRIGGDEFAVIFDDPEGPRQEGSRHPGSVFDLTKRFQAQICRHKFPKLGEQAVGRLTISGGLASYPWDGQTAKELVCRADQLAMQSKRQGKNAITFGPRE